MFSVGMLMTLFGACGALVGGTMALIALVKRDREQDCEIIALVFLVLAIVGYFIASANWPPPAPPELLRREEPEP